MKTALSLLGTIVELSSRVIEPLIDVVCLPFLLMAGSSNLDAFPLQAGGFFVTFDGSHSFMTYALAFNQVFPNGNGLGICVVAATQTVGYFCTVDTITNAGCNVRVVRADGTDPANNTTVTGLFLAAQSTT